MTPARPGPPSAAPDTAAAADPTQAAEEEAEGRGRDRRRRGGPEGRERPAGLARLAWPLAVCLVTVAATVVPLLLAGPAFFMRGDTAAQFAPTWFHLGELTRGGTWPLTLDPDSWVGGNYAAEALFGIYNPVNALVWVPVSLAANLLVAVWAVKAVTLALLALGTYLLAVEYGARPWAAATVATALPISGFTLYWDAGSWASGLIAFAYAPWVWWAFRRTVRGALNPFWAFLAGALAVTQGNPYGTLAVVVAGVGVLVEGALARRWPGVLRVALVGLCVAAFLPLVYVPLLETADLTVRSGGPLFADNGKLRPSVGDLLQLGSPTYVPEIRAVTGPMRVPAVYFAWFVLPLLPWLRYDVLRRGRDLAGAWVVGAAYLLLTLAPSKLWMFRWPLRLVEYLYLALAVLFAVVLSRGLRRDAWRARTAASAGLVAAAGYLAWAQDPAWRGAALGGTLMLVVLGAALLGWHRLGRGGTTALAGLLVGGSVLVLAGQSLVFGENASSRVWHFPNDVAALQRQFAGYQGRVLQLADLKPIQASGNDRRLRAQWQDFLAGSMFHVAGVDAVNSYSGMGFLPFTQALCMSYDGLAKPCGYRRVWRPVAPGEPPLAELLGLDTVVAQTAMTEGVRPADGWRVDSANRRAVVLVRDRPHPWPDSRLTWTSPTVEVAVAQTVDPHHQRVEVATTGTGGRAVFALLAWPGYSATLDGRPVQVRQHPAGLLEVGLPPGESGVLEVTYQPPGRRLGTAAALAGTAGAVVLGIVVALAGRRSRRRAV